MLHFLPLLHEHGKLHWLMNVTQFCIPGITPLGHNVASFLKISGFSILLRMFNETLAYN